MNKPKITAFQSLLVAVPEISSEEVREIQQEAHRYEGESPEQLLYKLILQTASVIAFHENSQNDRSNDNYLEDGIKLIDKAVTFGKERSAAN